MSDADASRADMPGPKPAVDYRLAFTQAEQAYREATATLLELLELHAPEAGEGADFGSQFCHHDGQPYPCDTVSIVHTSHPSLKTAVTRRRAMSETNRETSVSRPSDKAALGPRHPTGSPEDHFQPDPQMGQQHADRTAPLTDDMVTAMAYALSSAFHAKYSLESMRVVARQALSAGLAGCTLVTPPEPDADRDPMGRAKHIWNTGDYSVTAAGDRVAIKTGRDGLGDGIAFTAALARQVAAALIAGADRIEPAGGGQHG
jgi:hypothetical protein